MRPSFRTATALGASLIALVPAASPAAEMGPYNWAGFYFGGNAGAVNDHATGNASYPNSAATSGFSFSAGDLYLGSDPEDFGLPTLFDLSKSGPAVGVDAGYNFTSGSIVYGVEGDFHLLEQGQGSSTELTSSGQTSVTFDSTLSSLATLRGRVGVSADRLLLFATAGLATGQSSLSTDFHFLDTGKGAALSGNGSALPIGYVAGAGAEYAVTDQLSIKGEALYYNLGSQSITATPTSAFAGITSETAEPYSATVQHSGVIVDTGLNFRF